ncbi:MULTISPECIES: hypothetical protein [unclassified Microbacterium]|uniref:hypothetical protein n=1 Tax=unclassified Microbacterium TaxID=2609290 RepID=UPI000C2CB040|nr:MULTISPECIES: hypothetical protein [unclassified Microbacterium]
MSDEEEPLLICSAVVYFWEQNVTDNGVDIEMMPAMDTMISATIAQDDGELRQGEFLHFWSEALTRVDRWREDHPSIHHTEVSIRVSLSGPEAARGIAVSADMLREAATRGAELMID